MELLLLITVGVTAFCFDFARVTTEVVKPLFAFPDGFLIRGNQEKKSLLVNIGEECSENFDNILKHFPHVEITKEKWCTNELMEMNLKITQTRKLIANKIEKLLVEVINPTTYPDTLYSKVYSRHTPDDLRLKIKLETPSLPLIKNKKPVEDVSASTNPSTFFDRISNLDTGLPSYSEFEKFFTNNFPFWDSVHKPIFEEKPLTPIKLLDVVTKAPKVHYHWDYQSHLIAYMAMIILALVFFVLSLWGLYYRYRRGRDIRSHARSRIPTHPDAFPVAIVNIPHDYKQPPEDMQPPPVFFKPEGI